MPSTTSRPTRRRAAPDPRRLEQSYNSAAATLNFIRALLKGGFANLREPEHWQLDFIPTTGIHTGFREIANRIHDAINYLESLGAVNQTLLVRDRVRSAPEVLAEQGDCVSHYATSAPA